MRPTLRYGRANAAPRELFGVALRHYRNRDHPLGVIDFAWYDHLEDLGYAPAYGPPTHGCLDALDLMPAGSVVAVSDAFYVASVTVRGRDCARSIPAPGDSNAA